MPAELEVLRHRAPVVDTWIYLRLIDSVSLPLLATVHSLSLVFLFLDESSIHPYLTL